VIDMPKAYVIRRRRCLFTLDASAGEPLVFVNEHRARLTDGALRVGLHGVTNVGQIEVDDRRAMLPGGWLSTVDLPTVRGPCNATTGAFAVRSMITSDVPF
jgi:hypothetical protein